ncbi:MAG: hypothetical protein WBQ21_07395 [Solirubrobacteraceae bacterium]
MEPVVGVWVGVVPAGVMVAGVVVVLAGATVPGWAPLEGVVAAGVLVVGLVLAGVPAAAAVVAGAFEVKVPLTRADAGTGNPRMLLGVLVFAVAVAAAVAGKPVASVASTSATSVHNAVARMVCGLRAGRIVIA